MSEEIRPGRYRHFKGKEYEVLGVARHSETEEEYVVYRQLYGEHSLWVRPPPCGTRWLPATARPSDGSPMWARKPDVRTKKS